LLAAAVILGLVTAIVVAEFRLLDVIGIELPIIQAPMAGETTPELVAAGQRSGRSRLAWLRHTVL